MERGAIELHFSRLKKEFLRNIFKNKYVIKEDI